MVDNSIGIDSDSIFSASIDHVSERLGVSHSGVEAIANRLIDPIPGIEFSILGMFKVEDRLLRRKHFDSQVTSFAYHFAFFGNIIVGPSEHFNDSSFLSLLKIIGLVDGWVVPNKVNIIEDESSFDELSFFCFNFNFEKITCSFRNIVFF